MSLSTAYDMEIYPFANKVVILTLTKATLDNDGTTYNCKIYPDNWDQANMVTLSVIGESLHASYAQYIHTHPYICTHNTHTHTRTVHTHTSILYMYTQHTHTHTHTHTDIHTDKMLSMYTLLLKLNESILNVYKYTYTYMHAGSAVHAHSEMIEVYIILLYAQVDLAQSPLHPPL